MKPRNPNAGAVQPRSETPREAREGNNLVRYESLEEMFNDSGI